MKKNLFGILPLLLLAAAGCNRDLSPYNFGNTSFQPPAAGNPCAVANDPSHVWSNLETDPTTNSQLWDGSWPAVSINSSWSPVASTGCHSWKVQYGAMGAGGSNYGFWFGYSFYAADGPPPPTSPGMTQLQFSYLLSQSMKTGLTLQEGNTQGGNSESWTAIVTLPPAPTWQTFTLPFSAFSGGTTFDSGDINQISFDNSYLPYPATTLYIDDIKFLP